MKTYAVVALFNPLDVGTSYQSQGMASARHPQENKGFEGGSAARRRFRRG
ncbi:hypothetical protein [Humibacter ginsengisoli]